MLWDPNLSPNISLLAGEKQSELISSDTVKPLLEEKPERDEGLPARLPAHLPATRPDVKSVCLTSALDREPQQEVMKASGKDGVM